jgi:6-phosphogluconolactonase (cycloisomerase 2 family)
MPPDCHEHQQLQVGANGAFTLDAAYVAGYSGRDYVSIAQQPSSPTQNCLISNAAVTIQNANDTSVTVSCAEYAYVTNAVDNTLSTYSVDAATGALTGIGAPTPTDVSPHAILGFQADCGPAIFGYKNLLREYKRYVFVSNEDSNDVSAFAVNNTTGVLTAVFGSPFTAGTHPQAMASDGTYLYVANAGSNNVFHYAIDTNTGALAPAGLPFGAGKNPTSIVLVPGLASLYLYVANHGGSNDISAINVSDDTGVPGSRFPAGGNPLSLAVGAGGKFLYSANPDATKPSISGFSIDPASGALTQLSGSPFPLPVSQYMATDQTGAYLYVTTGTNIVGYAIDATTGALTALAGFPVAAGANAYSITVDPSNRFLYVTNDGAATVSGFTLDASTGALTSMAGPPFPAGNHPQFIATF